MEDNANINTSSFHLRFPAEVGQFSTSCLLPSTQQSSLPSSTLDFLIDNTASGMKRKVIEEPFSAKKRHRENDFAKSTSNNILTANFGINSTPQTPSKRYDRFIPHRGSLDIDYNNYELTKETSDIELDPKLTPSQRKLKEELNFLKSTEKRRLIDCRATLTPVFDKAAAGSALRVSCLFVYFFSSYYS
jgi:hypothetical protein